MNNQQFSSSFSLATDALYNLGIFGTLQKVETDVHGVLKWLDKDAGIDWMLKDKNDQLVGIASRIRFISDKNPTPYREFTIRYKMDSGKKTEFDKRIEAIEKGYLYPSLTTLSWYNKEDFVCGASINTKDLYLFVQKFLSYYSSQMRKTTDAFFIFVKWDDLKKHVPVNVVDAVT